MSAQPTVDLSQRRFTLQEYELMGQTGILGEDDRVELLDGAVVEMPPIGPMHAGTTNGLNSLLVQRLGNRAVVIVQNPLRLGPRSEPQPDLIVARARADFYRFAHPSPEDVQLVIEVADSSLAMDRGVKVPLYARAKIPEAWVIDTTDHAVHVHWDPREGVYRRVRTFHPGDKLVLSAFPDVALEVTEVFGL